jgi:mono/diheme cytochrome c family protein
MAFVFLRVIERLKPMKSMRGVWLVMGILALGFAGGAGVKAQENLDQGKSGAQLFASDCAICHKTSAGLSKGYPLGLEGFLREHYTASRESAAAIAAYVQATDKGAPPTAGRAAKKGKDDKTKDDKTKGDAKKPDSGKPAAPSDAISGDTKPADSNKPADAKPADTKPADTKPADKNPSDGQPPDISAPEKK